MAVVVLILVLFQHALAAPGIARFSRGVDLLAAAPDTRGELDDWSLVEPGDVTSRVAQQLAAFAVLGLIGVGSWVRAQKLLVKDHADRLRRVCFNWLLPAFLLRHIWLCQLDGQLYIVAAWSLCFHGVWFLLSLRTASVMEPQDRQMRGWIMLLSQGAMNSFLYPLLLHNEKFGEKALACAVLWDLGGNMWICQFALFAIAAFFRPGAVGDEPIGKEGLELGDGIELDELTEEGERLLQPRRSAPLGVLPSKSPWQTLMDGIPREIIIDALKQPVLVCCVLGFIFNVVGLPLPTIADLPLWVVGEPYKLVLYFLVGFYGDYRIGSHEAKRMCLALGVRYAISSTIIATVLLTLPMEPVYRYTVALALLSPTSSYLIHLIGEHDYGEGLLRLTVCTGFVSTLVSTFGQNLLMMVFNSWLTA